MIGVCFITFLILQCIYLVKADECVVYEFENNYDSLFANDVTMCTGMLKWSVGNYSEIGIERFNRYSETFISPSSTLSCSSSFEFTMSAGGTVEINVYTDSYSNLNHFTLLAMQVVPGGDDAVLGSIMADSSIRGWQTLKTTINGGGTQLGYIILMGAVSDDSIVLVDSFKYIPPNVSEDSCFLYQENIITDITTENVDTTTDANNGTEECVTYNFEEDFDIKFTTDNYLCEGFLPWHLDNYTSIDIESPNSQSTVYMAPNEVSSCISSFVFHMSPDGIVEANVYMDPVTVLDHIIVLAQKVTNNEYDTVAGFKMYYPENQVFTVGWNVLRFSLLDLTSFDGYLIFIGSAETGSAVLVDSVRYIPPLTSPDDASCDIY